MCQRGYIYIVQKAGDNNLVYEGNLAQAWAHFDVADVLVTNTDGSFCIERDTSPYPTIGTITRVPVGHSDE